MRRSIMSLVLVATTCRRSAPRIVRAPPVSAFLHHHHRQKLSLDINKRALVSMAKPKRGSVVESYQTVSVNCSKCGERLFRYKKKNGTKSNLVKCYVERISEDSAGLLTKNQDDESCQEKGFLWHCPSCDTNFARSARIHGRPALKIVGGKVRMTKK